MQASGTQPKIGPIRVAACARVWLRLNRVPVTKVTPGRKPALRRKAAFCAPMAAASSGATGPCAGLKASDSATIRSAASTQSTAAGPQRPGTRSETRLPQKPPVRKQTNRRAISQATGWPAWDSETANWVELPLMNEV